MRVESKRVLWRVILFAWAGMLMEVFFTAAFAFKSGNWSLHGHSSPWMMLDYGLLGVALMPLAGPLIRCGVPLAVRAGVYMLGIFAVELVSGWVFDWCGLSIWDYSRLPCNLHGYVTLLYAPLWYGLGLCLESLYRRIDAMARVLALGLTAEGIPAR